MLKGHTRIHTQYLRMFLSFGHMGKGVKIDPTCDIRSGAAPYIYMGDHVRMDKDVWLNIPFEAESSEVEKMIIQIGDRTDIGRRCMITASNCIQIGNDVLFGPSVLLADHSHEFQDISRPVMDQGITQPGRIIIEDGCWFGYNSSVVTHKGREIVIGRNSVIGANAVITSSCPPYSVMVGNPARNIHCKSRDTQTSEDGSSRHETELVSYDEIYTLSKN